LGTPLSVEEDDEEDGKAELLLPLSFGTEVKVGFGTCGNTFSWKGTSATALATNDAEEEDDDDACCVGCCCF
jgi:hypothetical protein